MEQAIAYAGYLAVGIAIGLAAVAARRSSVLDDRAGYALLYFRFFMIFQAAGMGLLFAWGLSKDPFYIQWCWGLAYIGNVSFMRGLNLAIRRSQAKWRYGILLLSVPLIAIVVTGGLTRNVEIHLVNILYTIMMLEIHRALNLPDVKRKKASFLLRGMALIMIVPIVGRSVMVIADPALEQEARFVWLIVHTSLVVLMTIMTLLLLNWSLMTKFRDASLTDALTGLHNRRSLDSWYEQTRSLAIRNGHMTGMLICDLDHFKSVNDKWGHDVGDDVLRQFAEILTKTTRDTDFVARIGGEEFIVVLPMANKEAVELLAERIRNLTASAPFRMEVGNLPITTSIGAALMDGDTSQQEAYEEADRNLYKAKETGRNKVVFSIVTVYHPSEEEIGPAWTGN